MYKKILDLGDISIEKYGKYRLCYIDDISETVFNPNYDPSSWKSEEMMSWIPNPEYVPGQREKWAYFTNISLSEQWGDDWDDAPYEHNAGYPYDDHWDSSKEHTILQVGFSTPSDMYVKYPCDYGCGNSPFSVEDINNGAVAWIYGICGSKKDRKVLSIHAGDTLQEFIDKLGGL
jgi:hypothetical protein